MWLHQEDCSKQEDASSCVNHRGDGAPVLVMGDTAGASKIDAHPQECPSDLVGWGQCCTTMGLILAEQEENLVETQ